LRGFADREAGPGVGPDARRPADSADAARSAVEFPKRGRRFADPGLLAGRPMFIWVYVVALLLAATADFGNFYQIIQYAMPSVQDVLLFLIVLGFTACVIFLAHVTGVMLRALRARDKSVIPAMVWLCTVVWLALGLCGLYLRLTYQQSTQQNQAISITNQASPAPSLPASPTPGASPGPGAAATAGGSQARTTVPVVGAALMFLGLYLGTGLVAVTGGYLTHNPALAAFKRARRAVEQQVGPTADAAEAYETARGELARLELLERNAEVIAWASQVELAYQRERLKEETRAWIARRVQDPALTDAYFPEDQQ
jgi:hypothetical protein